MTQATIVDFKTASERIKAQKAKVEVVEIDEDEEVDVSYLTPEEFIQELVSSMILDLVASLYYYDLQLHTDDNSLKDLLLVDLALRALFHKAYHMPHSLHSISEKMFDIDDPQGMLNSLLELTVSEDDIE